jgi:hypothetical protein
MKFLEAWRLKRRLKRQLMELVLDLMVDRLPLIEELVDHGVVRLEKYLDDYGQDQHAIHTIECDMIP